MNRGDGKYEQQREDKDAHARMRKTAAARDYMMGVPEPYMAPSSSQAARCFFFSDDLSDICDITSAEFFILRASDFAFSSNANLSVLAFASSFFRFFSSAFRCASSAFRRFGSSSDDSLFMLGVLFFDLVDESLSEERPKNLDTEGDVIVGVEEAGN